MAEDVTFHLEMRRGKQLIAYWDVTATTQLYWSAIPGNEIILNNKEALYGFKLETNVRDMERGT